MPKIKNVAVNILEYALMLSTVLYSAVLSLYTSAQSNTFARVGMAILAVLIIINIKRINFAVLKKMLFFGTIFLVFMVFTRYNLVRCTLYFAGLFLLMLLYTMLKERPDGSFDLILKLSDIMSVLSVISVFFYLFGTLLNLIPFLKGEATYMWGDEQRVVTHYLSLMYEAQDVEIFGVNMLRNCSIFPEAPGFAAYLSVSLAGEMFIRKKLRYFNIVALCLGAVSSLSAKAILLMALCFVLYFVFKNSQNKKATIIRAVLVFVPAFIFAAVIILDKMQSYSFFIRLDDLFASLKTFSENILFGSGYYNNESIIKNFSYEFRANDGLSMGLAVLLAQGGLYMFFFYIFSLVKGVICSADKIKTTLFAVIFLGMLFITNIPFGMITLLILAVFLESGSYGFYNKLLRKK